MWPFRKRPTEPPASTPPPFDKPCGFGFKTVWWAFRNVDTFAVAAAIELQPPTRPANWQTGVLRSYEGDIFVTPPVEQWTLVVSSRLKCKPDVLRQPLVELSQMFGTVQVFATHRVAEYHLWAQAVDGQLTRGYAYAGDSGATLWDEGPASHAERTLGFSFFDERPSTASDDTYWQRGDLAYPNEDDVMDLARLWSFAPEDLDNYQPAQPALGVLGGAARRLSR